MLGIIVLVFVSWGILFLVEKKSLLALGLTPVPLRLLQLIIGFIVTALLCGSIQLIEVTLKEAQLTANPDFSFTQLSQMLVWDLRSVVTEELLFRGALLVIIMKRWGKQTGTILTAVAFGIYHWFSFGLLGQLVPMIVIGVGTGMMGYAFATAFAKSKSIMMPIGLHLGWNFTLNTLFSRGPLGNGWLQIEGGHVISDFYSLVGLWLAPVILWTIINYALKRQPD